MIDVNQLTELISAFRVETEKESISPETVGKLLQDIVDLLANESTDAERQILDDWKHCASRAQRGSLLTPLPRRSRGRACDTPVAIAATSAEPKCGNAASGSAESITLR